MHVKYYMIFWFTHQALKYAAKIRNTPIVTISCFENHFENENYVSNLYELSSFVYNVNTLYENHFCAQNFTK